MYLLCGTCLVYPRSFLAVGTGIFVLDKGKHSLVRQLIGLLGDPTPPLGVVGFWSCA